MNKLLPSVLNQPSVSIVRLGTDTSTPADVQTWNHGGIWIGELKFKTPGQVKGTEFAVYLEFRDQESIISTLTGLYGQIVQFMEKQHSNRIGFLFRWLGTERIDPIFDPSINKQIVARPDGETWIGEMTLNGHGSEYKLSVALGRFDNREAITEYGTHLYEQLSVYLDDRYKARLTQLSAYLSRESGGKQ